MRGKICVYAKPEMKMRRIQEEKKSIFNVNKRERGKFHE